MMKYAAIALSAVLMGSMFQPAANADEINGREFTQGIMNPPVCSKKIIEESVSSISGVALLYRVTGENDPTAAIQFMDTIVGAKGNFPLETSQLDFYATPGTDRTLLLLYAKHPETSQDCVVYWNDMMTIKEVGDIEDKMRGI